MEDNNKNLSEDGKKSNNNSNTQYNSIIQSSNSNSINENTERRIISKISELLNDICEENRKDFKNDKNPNLKIFVSKIIPNISIKDYLERLYKYTKMNSSTIILILIYIDRLCNIYKFKLTYYNIHKLILASMIIAIKYNEDACFFNKNYAKIGGVSTTELCFLEYNFISLINFNLFVSEELFKKYNDYISSADSEEDEFENDDDSDNDVYNNNENTKDNNV